MKSGAVYIVANRKNCAIYTGSTSKLVQRVYQHRTMLIEGFTKTHGCVLLVWFEAHEDLQEAEARLATARSERTASKPRKRAS